MAGVASKGGISNSSLSILLVEVEEGELIVVAVRREEETGALHCCWCCCCDNDGEKLEAEDDEKARTKPRTLLAVGFARPEGRGREREKCVWVCGWLGVM